MPDKATGVTKVKPEKKSSTAAPAPVDVKASVPLEIKVAPESIEALGGIAATPGSPLGAEGSRPALESIANSAEPTPVLIAAEQPPVPVIVVAAEQAVSPQVTPGTPPQAVSGPIVEQATTTITTTAPVPVTVAKDEKVTLSPTTTEQEDIVTAGQRRISLIWEVTQAVIAVLITAAVIYCAVGQILSSELANAFFLIIGFYYSRTNHTAIGGVGAKNGKYAGR